MKQFVLRLFAAIGIILTLTLSLGGYIGWKWITRPHDEPKAPEIMVLDLDLDRPFGEAQKSFRFSLPALVEEDGEIPLFTLVRAIKAAKDDPRVKGIVAKMGSYAPSLAQSQEVAEALRSFRETGKFTYVYAPSYGDFASGGAIYYLASQFENIWLQPIGAVGLTNLGIETPFGKTALDKLGIQTDFLRREEYKSVMENVSRDSFSPTVKANMEEMLRSMNNQIIDGIALGRKIDKSKAAAMLSAGPFTTTEALQAGLVTKVGYEDDMNKELEEKASKEAVYVDPYDFLYYANKQKDKKVEPKGTVAVIYADGIISDIQNKGPYRLAEDNIIDTQGVVDAFADAVDDKDVKAILFRVNSPGGSPVASETIRHALVKAKEAGKPVFVSMGHVAASGGYWISMNADRIIADPATLTGSIGVVAGKVVLGGLMEKLGIKWDEVKLGENAQMWSSRAPFDAKGRERMNAMLDETYKSFTDNVAAARKIPPERIGEVAKGRVFTGEQALKAGLVDELGGMDVAIASLKKQLGLQPEDKVTLVQFPAPETPTSILIRIIQNLGYHGAMVADFTHQLQKTKATFGPLWDEVSSTESIAARLPAAYGSTGY